MNLRKLKNILSKPAYEKVKPIETAIEKHNLSVYGETIDSVSTGDLVFHIVDEKNKIGLDVVAGNNKELIENINIKGYTPKNEAEKSFLDALRSIANELSAIA